MKKHFLVLTLIFTLGGINEKVHSQVTQVDLKRYWHYRYRLINYFMSVGMGNSPTDPTNNIPGQSLPANIRNLNDDHILYWGDEGRTLGYYIGVLATEYRLLKDNNQNTNETIMELFYALHAVFRLDSLGIRFFVDNGIALDNAKIASSNPTFPGYGYICGDDVGAGFYNNLPTPPALSATPYGGNCIFGFGTVGPVSVIQSAMVNMNNSQNVYDNSTSMDNMIGVMMGLALATKLLDNNIVSFYDQNNVLHNFGIQYMDLQSMALKLGSRISQYFASWGYAHIGYPDANETTWGDESPYIMEYPLILLNNNLFGPPYFPPINQQVWDLLSSFCDLDINQDFQNIEMASEVAAMSNDGGNYGSPFNFFKEYSVGNHCVAGYPDYGFEQFYEAINWILYPDYDLLGTIDFCEMENIIVNAPSDGPFCHISEYGQNGDFHPNEDFALNGWASDRRFVAQPPFQFEGQADAFEGNYPGLDYMLFFNLYYLLMEKLQQPAIIQNPSTFAIAQSLAYGGYSTVYPFDYYFIQQGNPNENVWFNIGFNNNSNPNTVLSPFIIQAYCWPIIVNALSVNANVTLSDNATGSGALELLGGNQYYIDLNPTQTNIIIQRGANFDAVCNQTCPGCESPYYSGYYFQPDQNANSDARKAGKNNDSLPTYKKSVEFDTLINKDIIKAYPNPFSTQTTVEFNLENNEAISISLYDTKGCLIDNLINNVVYQKGSHSFIYNGSYISSSSYTLLLHTNRGDKNFTLVKLK